LHAASYHTDVLALDGRMTVQRVFPRAWHLLTADGFVLTVTCAPYNGPLGVRIDRVSLEGLPVQVGMRAELRGMALRVGRVCVSLQGAVEWQARAPHPQPRTQADFVRGVPDGWERGLGGEGYTSLLGLGPGLTPAGDDFLCGYLAGLRILGRRAGVDTSDLVDRLAGEVNALAAARTTALSRTLLYYAGRGTVVEPLEDVLYSLEPAGSASSLDDQTPGYRRLLGIGHSSGRDMFCGALVALQTVREWKERGDGAAPRD
jgi:hypothetical protein